MTDVTADWLQAQVHRGMTDAQIGAAAGLARNTIQGMRGRYGIAAARPVGKTRRGEDAPVVDEPPPAPTAKSKPITVAEFLLNKRRAVCPVCQLKEAVKAVVLDARKKGERQADILECLEVCYRVTVTPRDYTAHFSGRHDQ